MKTFIRTICLAALLAAGSAWAQQQPADNPDNPHSTKAKADATKAAGATNNNTSVNAAETNNPYSTDYKDREQMQGSMAGMDHDAMMKNATPQQQLQKLHFANLHEIEMAKLAEQSGSDRVKSYAQTIERDHQTADMQLTDLAKKKHFTLSDKPMDAERQQHKDMMKDQLSSLQGADFDRAFINQMITGHQKLTSLAQAWTQDCKDKDVCNLINAQLPTLQQHERMAEQLRGPQAQGRAP
jgi:predicted outer membrane protein